MYIFVIEFEMDFDIIAHAFSLTRHALKGSYSVTKGDATSCAPNGSHSRVPPGSPRFTFSQSCPQILFLDFLYNSISTFPLQHDFRLPFILWFQNVL